MSEETGQFTEIVVTPEPSIATMLQTMIERGVTTENVSALEKMTALYERMQDRDAERQFAVAFNAMAVEIPRIKATKPVRNKDGTVRYKFTPLEELDAEVRPLALRFGFSYWWSEGEQQPDKITKIFTIQHVAGHKRSTSYTVRRSSPPGSNDSQADGSTHAYGKRGTFCDAWGIVTEHQDDDARGESDKPIGKALAEDLEARVKACGADREAFLKFAGAANFESISMDRFDALDDMLKRKEIGAGRRNEKGEYIF